MATTKNLKRSSPNFKFGDDDNDDVKSEKQNPVEKNDTRVTFEMPKDLHQKIKIMANFEFSTIKDIINESIKKTIVQYEKTHGELVKIPKSKA